MVLDQPEYQQPRLAPVFTGAVRLDTTSISCFCYSVKHPLFKFFVRRVVFNPPRTDFSVGIGQRHFHWRDYSLPSIKSSGVIRRTFTVASPLSLPILATIGPSPGGTSLMAADACSNPRFITSAGS